MKTQEIYNAQLSVSKFYTIESIEDLISRLEYMGESYYDTNTNSINIKRNRKPTILDNFDIRDILKDWLKSLPIEKNDLDIMVQNVEFMFNITKIGEDEKHIIKVYLY